jgi:fructose-1,6-bisphosphatase/inositol monophosphatase family enzyme
MEGVIGTIFLPGPLRSTVNVDLSRLATNTWFRCAAHEYRMAAAGHCHLLFYYRLMPWDHAAGWLLHKEAGGYSAHSRPRSSAMPFGCISVSRSGLHG